MSRLKQALSRINPLREPRTTFEKAERVVKARGWRRVELAYKYGFLKEQDLRELARQAAKQELRQARKRRSSTGFFENLSKISEGMERAGAGVLEFAGFDIFAPPEKPRRKTVRRKRRKSRKKRSRTVVIKVV